MDNKLKELRLNKEFNGKIGMTQQEIADEIGVTKRTYIYWEKGERQIKPEKAKQLADYFGVSVGYLLGHCNFKTYHEEDFFNVTGYPVSIESEETPNNVVKIKQSKNTLSDKELMALPPEERKEYLNNFFGQVNDALSSLTDNIDDVINTISKNQVDLLSNNLIKALAKLNDVKNKDQNPHIRQ